MVETWASEITFVEMFHGLKNLVGDVARHDAAAAKDAAKRAIMERMSMRQWATHAVGATTDTRCSAYRCVARVQRGL